MIYRELKSWVPERRRTLLAHVGLASDPAVDASIVVPVLDGRPALGTWQSIVLVDTNRDNPRRHVRLSFVRG